MFKLPAYDPLVIAWLGIGVLALTALALMLSPRIFFRPDPQLATRSCPCFSREDFLRQAHVCARLADDCDDPRLAERLRAMASDLLAKADDFEESPSEPAKRLLWPRVGGRRSRRPHNKQVVN